MSTMYECRDTFLVSSFYATKLLFWAARERNVSVEMIEKILTEMESYPEGCVPIMFYQTPFHSAAHSGSEYKLKLIIEDYIKRRRNGDGRTLYDLN